jgi:hypothetical protein
MSGGTKTGSQIRIGRMSSRRLPETIVNYWLSSVVAIKLVLL